MSSWGMRCTVVALGVVLMGFASGAVAVAKAVPRSPAPCVRVAR